jgi:hypothetical protein
LINDPNVAKRLPGRYRYGILDPRGAAQRITDAAVAVGSFMIDVYTALQPKYWSPTTVGGRPAITDGKYITDPVGMDRHKPGTAPGDRSVFRSGVDAERTTLDAARFADKHGLWDAQNKAKVPIANGPVGYLSNGEPTSTVNVYRRATRNGCYLIHGSPGS